MYKEYRSKFMRKVLKRVPYMRNREIEIIVELLKTRQPRRCLEWGSGYSTTYFPKFLPATSSWCAIEHEQAWAHRVRRMNRLPNVKVVHIAPHVLQWSDRAADGSYGDLRDYIEFPAKLGHFDFILVDGRARSECVKQAFSLLDDAGVVVLHDANREYYHQHFGLFPYQAFFSDYSTDSHGLWMGSKATNIEKVLNMPRHRTVWATCNAYGKLLRI